MSRYPPHYAGSAPQAYPVIYKASPPVSPSFPFLRGNNYVLPSDIKNIAVETFAHRIVTNVNGAAGTEAARKEITEILRNVPVPEMNK